MTAPLCKSVIYETFVLMGGNRVVLLFFAFLEEKRVQKLDRMKDGLVSTFLNLHASHAEKPHLISSIKTNASQIMFSAETGFSETLLGPG